MNTGIDLRQLRYFVCLADELHFGRAAERLGIQQAPLSQQIKLLEERLGVVLFHRTTRRTRLSTAGETLLRHARDLLDGVDRAVAQTRAMADEATGRIVVAGIQVALTHLLPPILAEFRMAWPAVIVDVIPLGTGEQLRGLEAGQINIAFIRPIEQAAFMQTATLASEGFVAALPKDHPLTEKDTLTLQDFRGEYLVAYASILGAHYSAIVAGALHRAGIHPRVVQECTHTMAVATQVASGLGIALMPSWITHIRSPYLAFRPVPELTHALDIIIASPSGETSPVVLDFIETAKRVSARVAPTLGFLPSKNAGA